MYLTTPLRWLIDQYLDLMTITSVVIGKHITSLPPAVLVPLTSLHGFRSCSRTPPPTTRTLPPKVIHHQAIAKLKTALIHVHTEEDLQKLESGIEDIM